MNEEESKQKLRRLVPWIVAAIIFMALSCVVLVLSGRSFGLWPMVVGDLVFTGVVLWVIWRSLGRRP